MQRFGGFALLVTMCCFAGCGTWSRSCCSKADAPVRPAARRLSAPSKDGFTQMNASADTRKIYVSSSGSDQNDGFSEAKPLKTPAAGLQKLRDGHPDWLLFKRGDSFEGGLDTWRLSGRSASEPMVVSGYGDGARPLFRTGKGEAIDAVQSGGAGERHDHVWFIGLAFYANARDPADPAFDKNLDSAEGIHWRTGTKDLLIEDCVLRFFGLAVTFQDSDNLGMSGIRLRRNQFLDSYNLESGGHSQGIYMAGTHGVLIEENLFDHNGWNDQVPGAEPTIFNHNLYVDNGNTDVVLRNNIFLRASSHGAQLRPGGIANGNLFAYNAIGLLVGGGTAPEAGGVTGEVIDNVVLHGTDIGPMVKEYGIDLDNIRTLTVRNNVIANARSPKGNTGLTPEMKGVTYSHNTIYNWPKGQNTSESCADPSRDLASYDAFLSGPGTFEHLIEGLRAQSAQNWHTEYMAQAINAYIRQGFAQQP
jgi:hypothetical protein